MMAFAQGHSTRARLVLRGVDNNRGLLIINVPCFSTENDQKRGNWQSCSWFKVSHAKSSARLVTHQVTQRSQKTHDGNETMNKRTIVTRDND